MDLDLEPMACMATFSPVQLPFSNRKRYMYVIIDVFGINEKFNIGIYCGTEDYFFGIFIGPDLNSYTKFPVIREILSFLLLGKMISLLYHPF